MGIVKGKLSTTRQDKQHQFRPQRSLDLKRITFERIKTKNNKRSGKEWINSSNVLPTRNATVSALLWLTLLSVLKSLDTWPTVMWGSWNVLIEELAETFLPSVTFISTDFRSPPMISDLVRACSRSWFTVVTQGKAETYHSFSSFEALKNIACIAGAGFISLVFIEQEREKCEGERKTPPFISSCACTNGLEANWHLRHKLKSS